MWWVYPLKQCNLRRAHLLLKSRLLTVTNPFLLPPSEISYRIQSHRTEGALETYWPLPKWSQIRSLPSCQRGADPRKLKDSTPDQRHLRENAQSQAPGEVSWQDGTQSTLLTHEGHDATPPPSEVSQQRIWDGERGTVLYTPPRRQVQVTPLLYSSWAHYKAYCTGWVVGVACMTSYLLYMMS